MHSSFAFIIYHFICICYHLFAFIIIYHHSLFAFIISDRMLVIPYAGSLRRGGPSEGHPAPERQYANLPLLVIYGSSLSNRL